MPPVDPVIPAETTVPLSLPDVSDLTLEQKIGQMLCLGWDGPGCLLDINEQAREAVQELHAGSMILMGRNVRTPLSDTIDITGVRAMTERLQALSPDIPLLVSTDQEGGQVTRLQLPPFTPLPSARTLGRAGDPALACAVARLSGLELAAVGIQVNYAPVADVDSNPANPVIGDRSFGDTATTAAFVTTQIQGFTEAGTLSCAKHFPGHGDTYQDSHYALPSVAEPFSVLEERELPPFRAAIVAGIPAIMTAHILYPSVDNTGLPATLSAFWLTEILRNQLGFDGLIVTDCLEMRAVADHWGTARAAVLSARAGADLLLICHTRERQRAAYEALLEAAHSGELPLSRIEDAVRRVLAAKRRFLTRPQPPLSIIGCEAHRRIVEPIFAASRDRMRLTVLGEAAPA